MRRTPRNQVRTTEQHRSKRQPQPGDQDIEERSAVRRGVLPATPAREARGFSSARVATRASSLIRAVYPVKATNNPAPVSAEPTANVTAIPASPTTSKGKAFPTSTAAPSARPPGDRLTADLAEPYTSIPTKSLGYRGRTPEHVDPNPRRRVRDRGRRARGHDASGPARRQTRLPRQWGHRL